MYWENVLKEVLNKNSGQQSFAFTNIQSEKKVKAPTNEEGKKITYKSYAIGNSHPGVCFTKREAECMVWMLRGKTINGVAEKLKLSPRTVEFYLKNMKIKLSCRTKSDLIGAIHASDFMAGVDFL